MVSTKEGTALGTMGKAVSAVRDGGWRLEVGTRKHTKYRPLLTTRRCPAVSEQSAVNENVLFALRAMTQ